MELVQSNHIILHGRREGRKLRSTAENLSSGVGPADSIPRDEVMLKLRSQRELRADGNWAQSAKRTSLRANKAIRAPVLTKGPRHWCLRGKQPRWGWREGWGAGTVTHTHTPARDQVTKIIHQINKEAGTSN